jgi:hypothetical protein
MDMTIWIGGKVFEEQMSLESSIVQLVTIQPKMFPGMML